MIYRMGMCLVLLLLISGSTAGSVSSQAAEADQVYFSQGETNDNADDPAGSREGAIADMEQRALRQALASLMGPEKPAGNGADWETEIFAEPNRYVLSRQVFSHEQSSGQYRVTGQVELDMKRLAEDLQQRGVLAGEAGEGVAAEAPGAEDQDPDPGPAEAPAVETRDASPLPSPEAARLPATRAREQSVLWLVTEKWEQKEPWHLPRQQELGTAAQALFANSVQHEANDYEWKLDLLDTDAALNGSAADYEMTGTLPMEQALRLAEQRHGAALVVGTATQRRQADGNVYLVADLEIYGAPSARWMGQIHRELMLSSLETTGDYAEEVVQLGVLLAPQLDRLVRGGFASAASDHHGGDPGEAPEMTGGAWTLIIRAYRSPNDWEQLEQALRREVGQLEVTAVEIGAGSARVQLDHVPGNLAAMLKNLQLPKLRIEVLQEEPAMHTLHIAFRPLETTQ
jgi:hypothetical protein